MVKYPESHEDYLKAIYLIAKSHRGGWVSNREISEFMKIKPPSVSKMLYKLKKNELIDWQPRKPIRLTREGKKLAQDTVENYYRLFDFFKNILKINDKAVVQEICCKMEHLMTPEVYSALDDLNRKAIT